MSKTRSRNLPAVLTTHEQGLDIDAIAWNAIFLPKGTPREIADKLNAALATTLDTPTVRDQLTEMGVDLIAPDRRSPEYLQTFVETEIAKWARIIKAANIKPQ